MDIVHTNQIGTPLREGADYVTLLGSETIRKAMTETKRKMMMKSTAKIDKAGNGLVDVANSNQGCQWDEKAVMSMIGDIKLLLEKKLQVILTGATGVGKTYMARAVAKEMVGAAGAEEERIEFVQFHPGWSYSDFVSGMMKPVLVSEEKGKEVFKGQGGELYTTDNDDPNGKRTHFAGKASVSYAWKDGIFKKFAEKARADLDHNYVFIIDEINRADLSRVFGELFSLLEEGSRYFIDDDGNPHNEKGITLPNGYRFVIPKNLYIIGTMNNVDNCVESMDSALRRRFAWYGIEPSAKSRHDLMASKKE